MNGVIILHDTTVTNEIHDNVTSLWRLYAIFLTAIVGLLIPICYVSYWYCMFIYLLINQYL